MTCCEYSSGATADRSQTRCHTSHRMRTRDDTGTDFWMDAISGTRDCTTPLRQWTMSALTGVTTVVMKFDAGGALDAIQRFEPTQLSGTVRPDAGQAYVIRMTSSALGEVMQPLNVQSRSGANDSLVGDRSSTSTTPPRGQRVDVDLAGWLTFIRVRSASPLERGAHRGRRQRAAAEPTGRNGALPSSLLTIRRKTAASRNNTAG